MGQIRLSILFWIATSLFAQHSRLLPRPQQVRYGTGALRLEGVGVRFASAPSAEDRFVANEIASRLAAVVQHPVPIQGSTGACCAITLVREGDRPALPQKDETPGADSREAYQLQITPAGAEVHATSTAGLYYGAQTLLQMVEGNGSSAILPEAEIRDWPALPYRGVMVDFSHGPMPTEEEIKRQIEFVARFKSNQYYFYSELTIELRGYSLVNPRARYSQDQIRRIIEFARERHVDVVPCLEFYGHLHDLFRLERYAGLSALPHSGEINPRHPKILPMFQDWVGQMAELFPSTWFHVGLDEPWELERSGAAARGGMDPAQSYLGYVKAITEMVERRGKRAMLWADAGSGSDLYSRYPQLASQLPKGIIAVPWQYHIVKGFERLLAPFAKENIPQVVAPGITAYQEIAPDFERTFGNIDGFVAAGRKFNIIGMVNTNWADDAQLFYRATLPGMAYGSVAAWESGPVDRTNFWNDYAARLCSPAAAPEMAAGLASLGRAQTAIMQAIGDHSWFRLWDDPFYPPRLEKLGKRAESLRKARLEAEEAQERFQRAMALQADDYSIPSLLLDAKLIDYAGMKFLYALELAEIFAGKIGPRPTKEDIAFWTFTQASSYCHSRTQDLMDTIKELEEEYRSAWKAEYGPYRFGTALGRFQGEFEYWRRLQANLWDFQQTFQNGDPPPKLESLRPWGLRRP